MKQSTVFVAMSGGVDSSVAALLLQQQGYRVVGVYMKSWDGLPTADGIRFRDQCTWKQERRDALRVAAKLKIPFRTYDFVEEYRQAVIENFFSEYEAGRTPNPDVLCNREIKFKSFLERARAEGADYIATGHYAKVTKHSVTGGATYDLAAAMDDSKDQSYFLWTLTEQQLQYCIFPLGDLRKSEVRQIAARAALPTAAKKDSQGICFVGQVQLDEFLRARLPERVGAVVTSGGREVGSHRGASFYTIGQRHGLKIPSALPYYVTGKDVEKNVVYVAEGNSDDALYAGGARIDHASWVTKPPKEEATYVGRVRYRQPLFPLRIREDGAGVWECFFRDPQRAVTPGQSFVLYEESGRVVGGGIIREAVA